MVISIQEYRKTFLTCSPIISLGLPFLETASKFAFGDCPFPLLGPCGSGGTECTSRNEPDHECVLFLGHMTVSWTGVWPSCSLSVSPGIFAGTVRKKLSFCWGSYIRDVFYSRLPAAMSLGEEILPKNKANTVEIRSVTPSDISLKISLSIWIPKCLNICSWPCFTSLEPTKIFFLKPVIVGTWLTETEKSCIMPFFDLSYLLQPEQSFQNIHLIMSITPFSLPAYCT